MAEATISKFQYVKNSESVFSIPLYVEGSIDESKIGQVQVSSQVISYRDYEIDDAIYFWFNNTGLSAGTSAIFNVYLEYDGTVYETAVMMFKTYEPIWKDRQIGQQDLFNYTIYNGNGTEIYTGTSVRSATDVFARVNMPRIVDNKIQTSFPNFTDNRWYYINNEYVGILWSEDSESLKDYTRYAYDWTYSTDTYTETTLMNKPVNGHCDYRSPLFITYLFVGKPSGDFEVAEYIGGLGLPISVDPPTTEGYNCYYVKPSTLSGRNIVQFKRNGNVEFKYDSSYCAEYTLLYINLLGAIDTFLIEGNIYKTDSYSKSSYTKSMIIDSNTVKQSGKIDYINEISTSYSFSTGYLSDSESETFARHLLPSQTVWLYKNSSAEMIPVNITNSSAEYKKFLNGKSMVSYTVELSETKTRKKKISIW